ncbi:hypothetical protein DL96DRAFT_1718707 [Flagelloscypha sp. PMI_526]|nr:hypothetical protein DL96DRAFT_1718707 [Flagelloscypha sp. PMI_526]
MADALTMRSSSLTARPCSAFDIQSSVSSVGDVVNQHVPREVGHLDSSFMNWFRIFLSPSTMYKRTLNRWHKAVVPLEKFPNRDENGRVRPLFKPSLDNFSKSLTPKISDDMSNTITWTCPHYQFQSYEPSQHLAIRCFLDDPKGQNTATVLQYRSLLPKLPLQAFIEAHQDDPNFNIILQKYLCFLDTDRLIRIQVEIPNELTISLAIARWATNVHKGDIIHFDEACGRSILGSFILPWYPGWVFVHVRASEDTSIVPQIVAQLFRFNSIGREYTVLDSCGQLLPPPPPAIPTVFDGEWVTITEGPYINDTAYVQCVIGQTPGSELEVAYPMARVWVLPRLCDVCHSEEQLALGLEATLCRQCCLARPEACRRRDTSLSHRRSEGFAWNGINVVSGFASVTIPLQHLDVCSFVPLSVYNEFRESELETQSTTEWSFRAAPPPSCLQEPLLPTTVLRLGQPVLIHQDMYIVTDFPDTDASTTRPVVGVIPATIIPADVTGCGRVPLHVYYEDFVSFHPLSCIPLFEEGCQVKTRRGKRANEVYIVEHIDYEAFWLTLKGDEFIIKTRDWHNYQSISGSYADAEASLINHRPPIYISPPTQGKVSRRSTMLRLIGWEGIIVRIVFPASSAAHGIVGDLRKSAAKGRRGQILSATETDDWEVYPSGVRVLVEIQGTLQKTEVWLDAYEVIDIETNQYLHVAHPLDPLKTPNLSLRRTLAPLPSPSEHDLGWDSPVRAITPMPDNNQDEAAFWREGEGSSSNAPASAFHPSEETLPGFEALRHPRLRGIPLSLTYKHKGGSEQTCIGAVTEVEGYLQFVYTARSPKTVTGRTPPHTGFLKDVIRWLIYEPSTLKRVYGVIVVDDHCPELGTHMTTFAEDRVRKQEEEIQDDRLIYVFACKTEDLRTDNPPIYSISSHVLCVSATETGNEVTPAIAKARKRCKKKDTTIIRL